MGAAQITTIQQGVAAAYEGVVDDDGTPGLLCAFEADNAAGAAVWIEVLAGTINMQFPFTEDPQALARRLDVFGVLKPHLIEWQAREYATWGMDEIRPRDVAWIIDRLFTRVLGCDDAAYVPQVTMRDL